MKIQVDFDTCIGSGMCTTYVPQVFQLSEDGTRVVVLQEEKRPAAGQDESRYMQLVEVKAGMPATLALSLEGFVLDRNEGGGDENNKFDLDQVAALILGDVDVIGGQPAGDNTLRVEEIELVGAG